MPGFIPTADVVKVDASGRLFGQVIDNTFWYRFRAGAPTLSDLGTLAPAFNSFFEANIVNLLSQDYSYLGCVVTDQSSEVAPAINAPAFGVNGTVAEDSMPGGTCLCITFTTAGRGRSSRGRNYVSGIPVPQVLANAVDSTYAASLALGYNAYFADAIATDWEWVVVSHFTGGAARAAGLAQPIQGAVLSDLFVDSQRRRLTGRGT